MKKLLLALAAGALAAGTALPALAHGTHYDNDCAEAHSGTDGQHVPSNKTPHTHNGSTEMYGEVPDGESETGIRGQNGYLEVEGSAGSQKGGIHGTTAGPTAGRAFYGDVSNDGGTNHICVGSGGNKVDLKV